MNSFTVLIKCDFCEKTFEKARHKLKRSKKHYCSRECCDLHKKQTMKGQQNHRYGTKRTKEQKEKIGKLMKEKWKDSEYTKKVLLSRRIARENSEYPFGWDPDSVEKRKNTLLEKFGEDHNWKNKQNRKKCDETTIKLYGLSAIELAQKSITKETIEKRRKSLIENVLQISYKEYEELLPGKEKYYKQVRRITEQQPIHLLENYDKRGLIGKHDEPYHLDHIIPIFHGWVHGIDAEIIGDISNLRFIPALENIKKSSKIEEENNE